MIENSTKKCTKCKNIKPKIEFVKNNSSKDGLWSWCKSCQKAQRSIWEENNKSKKPWYNSYFNAKQRCQNKNNPNYFWYGARGIKFELTQKDCEFIWNRDNASKLKFPTIDRINKDGNYELNNCQFIENVENSSKDRNGHI